MGVLCPSACLLEKSMELSGMRQAICKVLGPGLAAPAEGHEPPIAVPHCKSGPVPAEKARPQRIYLPSRIDFITRFRLVSFTL